MLRSCLILGFSLALAGCDSMPSGMSERFATVPPQTRVYEADQRTVFNAAQLALKRMDFVLTRTALAQGIVEGRSGLRSDDAFREVRQFSFVIRLTELAEARTQVAVLLHEQVEQGSFKAGATDQVLRSHGLYDSYFEMLDQAVREASAPPSATP